MKRIRMFLLVPFFFVFCTAAWAQVSTGFQTFGSFSGSSFDSVNNSDLNVHFGVPIVMKAGRGLPFDYVLSYDSSIWFPSSISGTKAWTPVGGWGWHSDTEVETGYITYNQNLSVCDVLNPDGTTRPSNYYSYSNFVYHDSLNSPHPFYIFVDDADSECGQSASSYNGAATDGSGYSINAVGGSSKLSPPTVTMLPRFGAQVTAPQSGGLGSGTLTDANGNAVSAVWNGTTNTTTYTDTLGRTALTVAAPPSGAKTFTYTSAAGGPAVSATINYAPYTVLTSFGCAGTAEFGPTAENLVSSIVLADGETYSFAYEATPGHSTDVTGRIASVTLPTGGTISYAYSGGSHGITCADGSTATLTRTVNPGGAWTYTHTESGTAWTTTVGGPLSYSATYNFKQVSGTPNAYETERQVASLATVYTCYNGASKPCNTTSITLPIKRRTAWTVLGSQTSEVDTTYDYNSTTGASYGLPEDVKEYDYGLTLARETRTAYNYNTSCGVTNTSILDRPCTVTVTGTNGQGNPGQAAQISYTYNANGNMLSVTSNGLSSNFTYNSNGTMATSTDAASNQTTYGYGANSCGAFPDTVNMPLSLSGSAKWNCDGAVITGSTDANGQQTTYTYDNMNRLKTTTYPGSIGTVTNAYNLASSTASISVTYTNIGTSGGSRQDTTDLDGLGRIKDQTVRGVTTRTSYDALGRMYVVSIDNSGGAQDTYGYDGLGRTTSVSHADGNTAGISYSSNCATTTDEAGKTNQVCSDALGRVTSVVDGLGNTTSYSYDSLDDLHKVTQGAQTRTYNYDSLGRLTSAITPESGQTNYSYTSAGDLGTRVDARGITTCYGNWTVSSCDTSVGYDALHRLLEKSYSDGTPTATYSYDLGSIWGETTTNAKGRLSLAQVTSGSTLIAANAFEAYDALGRVTVYRQCAPYNCGHSDWRMVYSYDSAGDVTSYTHPAGFTVTQGIDVNQRPTSLTYGANMAVSSITYTAWGAISTMCGGQGCAQSEETRQYNNRLQPTLMELGNQSNLAADYSLTYTYAGNSNPPCTIPQGAGDNGSITGETYTDNVNAGYSHTFTYCYDAVNRLTHAVASGSPAYDLMYSYDQYGNGTCVPGSGGGLCPAMSYNSSTNRLTSIGSTAVSYDLAGNQLNDIWSTYEYDAEGRVKHSYSSGQWQYPTYNALGQRVQDYQGTDPMTLTYPIDLFGQRTGTFAQWPSQNWTGWNVYWSSVAGQRLNMGGASAYIEHSDAVGSMTMETDPAGAVQWDMVHYPWGQIWQEGGFRQSGFFAGLDRQVNDPLIPSATRELSAALGRWMTPDALGGDVTNPQSLNRYSYALNDPVSNIDPSGLASCPSADDGATVDPMHPHTCIDVVGYLTSDPSENVGVLPPGASEHGVPGGRDSSDSTSQSNTPKNSPCQGGQKGISPAEGKQVLNASQQFFGIPYNHQDCSLFVCNSINASNVLPYKIDRVTAQPSSVSISLSKDFKPVPASEEQVADIMVFSNPKPYHMGFYVPDPPMPPAINPYETFLSATEHIANQGVGGPRYLRPVRSNFAGSITYYRLQEPCHE